MKIEIDIHTLPRYFTRAITVSLNGKTVDNVTSASEYGGWIERFTGERINDDLETETLTGDVKIHGLTIADRESYAAKFPEFVQG